jgi:hypothetical protein
MSIGAIPHQTFPSIGYAITASSVGKTSLPVAPGLVIYSHFKHVTGTPAPEGTTGVNISKLKILNTLIEQLSKMKNREFLDMYTVSENDQKRIDALIDQYQKQIKATQTAPIYTPAAPAAGMLVNLTA